MYIYICTENVEQQSKHVLVLQKFSPRLCQGLAGQLDSYSYILYVHKHQRAAFLTSHQYE